MKFIGNFGHILEQNIMMVKKLSFPPRKFESMVT
jgi:hypothetical protein